MHKKVSNEGTWFYCGTPLDPHACAMRVIYLLDILAHTLPVT